MTVPLLLMLPRLRWFVTRMTPILLVRDARGLMVKHDMTCGRSTVDTHRNAWWLQRCWRRLRCWKYTSSVRRLFRVQMGEPKPDLSALPCAVVTMLLQGRRSNWEWRQVAQESREQNTGSRLADKIRTRRMRASDLLQKGALDWVMKSQRNVGL